ncbi:ABC transporter ATP-binding protein [Humibacter antri]
MAAVEVDGLRVTLSDGSRLVDDVSFQVESGRVLGIVGESGSGKSTLALALLGHARPGAAISAGSVRIGTTDLLALSDREMRAARGRVVAYVPQDPAAALNPVLKISTQLEEAIGGTRSGRRAAVRSVLGAVGLPSDDAFLARSASELSGGQKQRVGLAMAVVGQPDLLVLDEPTTGLDVTTQAKVLALVAELCRARSMAAIYISHDLAVIAEVADHVAVMYAGQLVEIGRCADVVSVPAHPYTRALLASVPSTRERTRLRSIPGRAPVPSPPYDGCRFAERCELATAVCRDATPELAALPDRWGSGRRVRCALSEQLDASARQSADVALRVEDRADDRVPLLQITDLAAGYDDRQVLFDVSAAVFPGECVAIVGESGSGKTTFSQCLAGLQERWSGTVRLDGSELAAVSSARTKQQRRQVQYVFQNPYASLNPRATIGASLAVPLTHFFGLTGRARDKRVGEVLDRVELPAAVADRYPADLSGGQRQRVAIARALACEPRVLICDEVTSALDVSVQAAVVELLRGLLAEGLSMLFVTHNLAVVRSLADWVLVLNNGMTVESGATESVLDAPADPYTRGLLADALDVPVAMAR